ncbi:MAG: hypothetical protein M3238_04850 [Actinomycetota bacterium]|nr:hypothetical protein [Actinomycetota bacterium]
MQLLLLVTAAGLIAFAGYSYGRVHGYTAGRRAGDLDAPRRPSAVQTLVLGTLGGMALAGAALLQGDRGVRIPTPARLDELAGRAERTAIEKAEQMAGDDHTSAPQRPDSDS